MALRSSYYRPMLAFFAIFMMITLTGMAGAGAQTTTPPAATSPSPSTGASPDQTAPPPATPAPQAVAPPAAPTPAPPVVAPPATPGAVTPPPAASAPPAGMVKVGNDLGIPGKLGQEVAKTPAGVGKGQIDVNAPRGTFGIPGAPHVSPILAFLWAAWVGWIFSTVGAFGGVMAGVGHMTVFGLGDYVRTFKDTSPGLNKTLTDSIRTSNQFLVGLSSIISVINYLKSRRMSWPLGLALGVGSIVGASGAVWFTAGKVSFSDYQGWFGVFVLVVGAVLIYEMTPAGQAGKKKTREAAQAFERTVREKKDIASAGVSLKSFSITHSVMTFFGTDFSFNPIAAFFGGVVIAAISAFIGVGGGFLYVPYLTSIVGLPMFVVAGTSALAVLISMITSITGFIGAGTSIHWALVGTELIGVFIGSLIGPRTAKYIPEKGLKLLFIVLAVYVGIGYVTKGFLGKSWVPM